MVYQAGIPTGTVPLLSDYLNIQGNFLALNSTFGVDHTTFDTVLQLGYHTSIHMIPQAMVTNTPGFGQLYTKTANDGIASSQELFYNIWNGSSALDIQLTRNFLPAVGSNGAFPNNGYTFLPGGFILQWGTTPSAVTSYTVVLASDGNINFPNTCFSAQAVFGSVSTTNSPAISSITPGGLGFTIKWATGTSANTYWMAIGN